MAETGLRVEGLTAVVHALEKIGLEVNDLKEAFSEIAKEAAEKAAEFAPKRTGRLAGDIRGNRAKGKAVVTAGRSAVPYAGPINYGWPHHNIRGALFMQRASDAMEPIAIERLESEINRIIREKGLAG